jgi:glycine cleavage system H protein
MPDTPAGLRYGQDHLWIRPGTGRGLVRVGVTDFAQRSLGDVVQVRMPGLGETLPAGQACGDIESVKSVNDLVAPVTGTVSARNDELAGTPELLDTDPYGRGWMFEAEIDPAALEAQSQSPSLRVAIPAIGGVLALSDEQRLRGLSRRGWRDC